MLETDHLLVQVADWTVAIVLVVAAAVAWRWSRPSSVLVGVTAATWVAGGLLAPAILWHRAVLVHLLLASPGWRPASRPGVVVVAGTYLVCVAAPGVFLTEAANVAQAATVVAVAAYGRHGSVGRARHHRSTALVAAAVLLAAVTVGGLLRSVTSVDLNAIALLVYEAAVVAAVLLVVSSLRPPVAATLTDLVIDLDQGGPRPGTLRDALARTLHDPDLRLGFWDPGAGAYVDERGQAVDDRGDTPRAALHVGSDDRPLALLLVDPELAADPGVVESIRTAAGIIALNARRQRELVHQVQDLEASRRRLVEVSDDERRRFQGRLRGGVARRLEDLTGDLVALEAHWSSEHLDRAIGHLRGTISDLTELAAGLRPRELAGGLRPALVVLADRVPCETTVDIDPTADAGLTPEAALTAWYVCAEALTNTAKHAPGAKVRVSVHRSDGTLHVRVADDGPGGARLLETGGLVGLRDRVDSLDGLLRMSSDGSGTVLEADLPLGHGAP